MANRGLLSALLAAAVIATALAADYSQSGKPCRALPQQQYDSYPSGACPMPSGGGYNAQLQDACKACENNANGDDKIRSLCLGAIFAACGVSVNNYTSVPCQNGLPPAGTLKVITQAITAGDYDTTMKTYLCINTAAYQGSRHYCVDDSTMLQSCLGCAFNATAKDACFRCMCAFGFESTTIGACLGCTSAGGPGCPDKCVDAVGLLPSDSTYYNVLLNSSDVCCNVCAVTCKACRYVDGCPRPYTPECDAAPKNCTATPNPPPATPAFVPGSYTPPTAPTYTTAPASANSSCPYRMDGRFCCSDQDCISANNNPYVYCNSQNQCNACGLPNTPSCPGRTVPPLPSTTSCPYQPMGGFCCNDQDCKTSTGQDFVYCNTKYYQCNACGLIGTPPCPGTNSPTTGVCPYINDYSHIARGVLCCSSSDCIKAIGNNYVYCNDIYQCNACGLPGTPTCPPPGAVPRGYGSSMGGYGGYGGSVCPSGVECCSDQTCQSKINNPYVFCNTTYYQCNACGNQDGQVCCPGAVCRSGFACTNGVCVSTGMSSAAIAGIAVGVLCAAVIVVAGVAAVVIRRRRAANTSDTTSQVGSFGSFAGSRAESL